ncbi:MAG: DsrE/DsrF/DrsH-like family protein [Clostridiales bacterium]|nr:DsrE/DsrF/DrsH-like family protein [Clostridiales bacterium]
MADEFKTISAEEFAKLDLSQYTLVDLREPDEVIVSGIDGAINVPFSSFTSKLDSIPKDKPVIVFCRVGDWSGEVAEILSDRDYDVTNLEGGYNAYKEYLDSNEVFIDAKGLKCPGPIVKVADTIKTLPEGSKVVVEATEDAFYSDIKVWADRTGNELLSEEAKDGIIKAVLKKRTVNTPVNTTAAGNDKTFVVFSGDLDKTIAAFIMANGAVGMGRNVTMFFTFWGLNILRRPEKVSVVKSFIEKMFGIMMPRGTKKLGLSRMNMGGMGAKMIRGIMKEKGVSSLEELIASARDHGVRLVACQMSMDIMGIKKEELIDGVELGGVATFLGSAEVSDMSLFI